MRFYPHFVTIGFAAALMLCGGAARAESGVLVERIAAVVDSDIILLSEVMSQARPAIAEMERASRGQSGQQMTTERKLDVVKETLQRLIDERLVAIQAQEMQITVTTEEVDRLVEEEAQGRGVDAETYRKAAEAQGIDWMTFRAMKRSQLLSYKVLSLRVRGRIKVTESEARRFYNDQVRDVRKMGSFEGAHILLRLSPDARAAEVAEVRKVAEEIRARIDAGEDFAELARSLSQDEATAKSGGSLGRLKTGALPGAMDRAFLDLEVGEVAGPIRTAAGYHVIRLNSRESLGVQRFAEVKDRIMNQLMQQEMMRQQEIWLKELRRRTFIDVRLFKHLEAERS